MVRLFRKTIFSPVLALFNLPKPGKVVHAADPGFWEGLWNSLRPIANTSGSSSKVSFNKEGNGHLSCVTGRSPCEPKLKRGFEEFPSAEWLT